MRKLRRWAFVAMLIAVWSGAWWNTSSAALSAQISTGAICVSTFADLNANGLLDPGEPPLAGVNVNLVTGGVIIATHITESNEPEFCFENLLRGNYTVTFADAPLYRMTTPHSGTFALDEGQRLTLDPFGAYPIAAENVRAELLARQAAHAPVPAPFSTSVRLLLATVGAALMMLLMIGLGVIILSVWRWKRPSAHSSPHP